MSNSEDETSADDAGITDDKLPEDLQPSEDNPLAEGLDDGETVDDLLEGGKEADETAEETAEETADRTADETAAETADDSDED